MPELIPLRALNQVSYCPRLYYLQYVDCVMPTNEHVESGLHDHRRVDDADLATRPRKEGEVVRTRGVQLSSEGLGVAGVLDLCEEFRPVIADSVVLNLINNESVTPADFVLWRDACQLTDAGRKKFFAAYEQRKATEITHPVYGYRMTYARMLEVQARMLAAFVRGGIPSYTGFTVR